MKFEILKEEIIFDDHFKINKAKIKHELFDSSFIEVDRLCFERGDSVAIIIYEKDTDMLLFTNQFRYPTIKEKGWILELVAGSIELGDIAEDRVRKEVEEEIGYMVNEIQFINSFFVSPGGTSERISLYYSEVDSKNKVFKGGGMKFEKEDIQLIKIKSSDVKEQMKTNQFRDAKTIIGLQWFYLNRYK
ncbi:ADP-ribose pyrophosphatase [Algoriphagus locisalis]|uniref:GDP-mannose pyrophosphatase n=1 Tax=Algoriphagus locisalis TaxID=305507 RepID=A0A1I6YKP6_9BACT|nr:NUDIX domain-containing protein [Algoriphagus locisalis]SFT51079.1 ADP-ribose pyrophosphatase [Algoriphagus locisalis]